MSTTRGRSSDTGPGRQAEQRDAATVGHVGDHVAERLGMAGHLEPDVEALAHAQLFLYLRQRRRTGVDREGDPRAAGQLEAVVADVGDDDVARARVPHHSCRHDADGAGAGDQHVLAEDAELQRGVHGVAEGVEDRGDLEWHVMGVPPGVLRGDGDVLGEGAVALHPDADGVGAQVSSPGEAVAATPADHVPLTADQVTDLDVGHRGADLDHLADELVTEDHRRRHGRLRPGVPGQQVQISAADTGSQDPYEDVARSDRGLGDVLEPQPRLAFELHESLHPRHARP